MFPLRDPCFSVNFGEFSRFPFFLFFSFREHHVANESRVDAVSPCKGQLPINLEGTDAWRIKDGGEGRKVERGKEARRHKVAIEKWKRDGCKI